MRAIDDDPIKRWQSISDWYVDLAGTDWAFVTPMIDLTAWVSVQTFAGSLYPTTSLWVLLVSLRKEHSPHSPFFSCCAQLKGPFEFELFWEAGRTRGKRLVTADQLRATFVSHITSLHFMESGAQRESSPHFPR
jgi:hypothetical protein